MYNIFQILENIHNVFLYKKSLKILVLIVVGGNISHPYFLSITYIKLLPNILNKPQLLEAPPPFGYFKTSTTLNQTKIIITD